MNGVQARRIFDLLVAAGYSPHLSAERDDEREDTVFSVTVELGGMEDGLPELAEIAVENDYEIYPDRNTAFYFGVEEESEDDSEEAPDPTAEVNA